MIQYSVAELFRLWHDSTLRTTEVAERLGVSTVFLYTLAKRHALPRRASPPPDEGFSQRRPDDPTPEQIEELKREIRERHLAERRAEPASTTHTRAWRHRSLQEH
jgi:transposase